MTQRIYLASLALVAVLTAYSAVEAQRGSGKPRRAEPPSFGEEVRDVYFSDAREKLIGERPQFGAVARSTAGGAAIPGAGDSPDDDPSGKSWSKLISATTLEDEVKKQKMIIDEVVTTPGPFKGGGFREARTSFSVLATMLGIAADFDGDVRWQEEAAGLRDMFARAGFNCKVGTDASYSEAKLRRDDLEALVRGAKVEIRDPLVDVTWDKVTNRAPLMQRMEESFQKRLKPWLANSGEFSKNSEQVYHEAQVLAALSEVIVQEGFEYWDDEDYSGYAKTMKQAATDIVEAVKLNSYDNAREAAGNISKACTECHEGYRA